MKQVKEKAITLVALVVTIIILLILAGVTISQIGGNNGLFSKVKQAVEKYKEAQSDEEKYLGELEGYLTNLETDDEEYEIAKPKDVLNGKKYYTKDGTLMTGTMKEHNTEDKTLESGESYVLEEGHYEGGKITAKKISQEKGTIADLKERIKPSIIGKKVTGLTGGVAESYEWEIFYVDDNNIYLIAKDYIKIDDCPQTNPLSGERHTLNKINDYQGYFTNILVDYEGSSNIKEEKIKKLNKDFFITNNYTSTDTSMKAVAYMMDIGLWTDKIVGSNDKVDYVIGGPSIELILNAYNVKYETNYGAKAYEENSTHGYRISKDANNYQYYISRMLQNKDGDYDSTFVIVDQTKATGMWIASPCSNVNYYVMYINCFGNVNGEGLGHTNALGFRPIVALKSTVQLEETEDGFKIK